MRGTITGRDVLRNGSTIVREFGPAAYGRCVLALVTGHPRTFLAAVSARAPGAPRPRRTLALAAALLAGVSAPAMRPHLPAAGDVAPCASACCEAPAHPPAA